MGKFNFQRPWNFNQNNRLVDRDFMEGETFDEVMQGYMPSLLTRGIDFRDDLDTIVRKTVKDAAQYDPRTLMKTPSSDNPTLTTGVAADGAFNQAYAVSGGAIPANWPFEATGPATVVGSAWAVKNSNTGLATVSTYRTVFDGPEMILTMYADANFTCDLFIDGQPSTLNPITWAPSTGFAPYGFQKLVWGTAKPEGRLLEFRTIGGIAGVYAKKPYSFRKPAPDRNPRVAVVGDSYVAGTVFNDAATGAVTTDSWLSGIYARMERELGIVSMVADGISGTGYLAPAGSNSPYTAAARIAWLQNVNPDVIVVHGGGANDIFNGFADSATIATAVAYFKTLRANHPNAKLVFVEGWAPPLFPYNARYTAIRQAVQAELVAAGVDVYYLAVASESTVPLAGTGWVTGTTGVGNSDIYVGSDQVHLSRAGNRFARGFLAPKLRRVLADSGLLVNTLL